MLKACKKCRREGEKLMLKGEKCSSAKCVTLKRPYAPGQHGQSFRGKVSEFGKQLREKQKAKRIYGVAEKQFSNYAEKAEKLVGNTSDNLLMLLETRADNIVYRLGFADSRSEARQMVSHGRFLINGKKATVPSILLKAGDVIEPVSKDAFKERKNSTIPSWLEFDAKKTSGKVNHLPTREEIDTTINSSLIIEFYSR